MRGDRGGVEAGGDFHARGRHYGREVNYPDHLVMGHITTRNGCGWLNRKVERRGSNKR